MSQGIALVALVGLLSFGPAAAAAASIKVGNGTAASCTEGALRAAVEMADAQGGGKIVFKCGGGPVTILLFEELTISDQTTIDGDSVITLQAVPPTGGFSSGQTLYVAPASTVELRSLTLRLGHQVVFNEGTLTIRHSVVSGAVNKNLKNSGSLTVIETAICCEIGDLFGAGIWNIGDLVVRRSFIGDSVGGGISNSGTARIDQSTIMNHRFEEGDGGAIENFGTMIIVDSTFANNLAFRYGGAIVNYGALRIRDSEFYGNTSLLGAGIYNVGQLTIHDTTITQNVARSAGGGIYTCCGGVTTLKKSNIRGNTPDDVVTAP